LRFIAFHYVLLFNHAYLRFLDKIMKKTYTFQAASFLLILFPSPLVLFRYFWEIAFFLRNKAAGA